VVEVNAALEGNERTVNDDPYGDGWLIKVRLSDPAEVDALLTAGAYRELLETL
jgi:glycine cleavage system H protein